MSTPSHTFDAIVVGSGITGGWAAKELTQKGLKTLLLERGRPVEHGTDYVGEHMLESDMPYRGWGDRQLYEKDYAIQKQCYAFNESTRHFFVNDSDHPYAQEDDRPFTWIRGYHLGGKSLMWARQCYRWSDLDFEANARDGNGVDWPIRYADIAPWYDHVESFAGICGQAEGLPQLPDGRFLPPMEMNCVEKAAKERLESTFSDRRLIHGRAAVLTQAHGGREACHYCGPCERGCSTGSYFSSQSATLPAAQATDNLTIRTHSIVHSVIYDENTDRATGVRVIDALTNEALEFFGSVVFLCASTLGSTQILLNSRTPRFSDGLGNSSGALGHYLMDHLMRAGASALMPGFEDSAYVGHRPNAIYIPRFRNVSESRPDYLRGYAFQGGAGRMGWEYGARTPGLGAEFKHALREPGPWGMRLVGFGECLPRYDNYVDLDPHETDKWGIPLLRTHTSWGENERAMRKEVSLAAAEMLEVMGGTMVTPQDDETPMGLTIHEMGTARMGRDPKTSVLNGWCQAHDISNLFVTDGAAMASSACQNPSITFMALTARACDYAVSEMKRGNIKT